MGVWSTGLYSGDFALDLRSTIRAVARLPYDGDKLLEILCETEPGAANSLDDEDHSTFWLVTADQFAKRGVVSERARERASTIIDNGSDIAMLEKLGMDPAGLRKRSKVLEELRARIAAPASGKPRSVLKKPQPYLMDVGDVLIYPTCEGKCINPYFASKERDRGWKGQDGWSAMVIVDRGRAFEFLVWYRPLTLALAMRDKPTLVALHQEMLWKFRNTGTCPPSHFKKMEFEKIGVLAIDRAKLGRIFPDMRPGTSAAINDISIANSLSIGPYTLESPIHKSRTVPRIGEILAD
jgi:hypothetical protein